MTKCVLLVDDDEDLIDIISRRLKRKEIECFKASSIEIAKNIYKQHSEVIKNIVCDLYLDCDNGLDFYEYLRAESNNIMFILSTGDDVGDSRISIYKQKDSKFDCLQKPFDIQYLIDIMEG